MCIMFNAQDFKPSETLLVSAPLATPPGQPQAWQLVYIHSITRISSSFGKPVNEVANNSALRAPLMVFALPNPHHMQEDDFTLFEVDAEAAQTIRDASDKLSDYYMNDTMPTVGSFGGSFRGRSIMSQPPLKVQAVGSYKISVAPSLSSLTDRAPWSKYAVTSAQVSQILEDMHARYSYADYAFVIAEGSDSYEQTSLFASNPTFKHAGFGIMYRNANSNGCLFPTSHEPKLDINGRISKETDMDVKVVALGAVIRPLSIATPKQHGQVSIPKRGPMIMESEYAKSFSPTASFLVRGDDSAARYIPKKWNSVHTLLSQLPRQGAGMHKHTFVQHETIRVATSWSLNGAFLNKDLLARKATENDVAVVDRMIMDLESWLLHRITTKSPWGTQIGFAPEHNDTLPYKGSLDQHWKLDVVFASLARQLADPGINDRVSDAVSRFSGLKHDCASVAYMNLDIPNIDLDEESYREKDTSARLVVAQDNSGVDTAGTSYIRISATLGAFETLEMRTVKKVQNPPAN